MVRMMRYSALAVLALVLVGAAAQTALAVEGAGGPRGSGLIFPYYNQTTGYRTFYRVTYAPNANGVEPPDVALHNLYFEAYTDPFGAGRRCREFNRFRPVTRNDHEVWELRTEAPNVTEGFSLTYLVERTTIGGIISFGGVAAYDSLFGDSAIVSTAEGWIVGVSAIPVLFDPDSPQPFIAFNDPAFMLAEAEGPSFNGPDGNIVDYEFQTFGNHFFVNFFNERIGLDPTEVVILPFTILNVNSFAWVQPREHFDGATNQWTWVGDWYDHDENPRNIPSGRINCWGRRTVNELTLPAPPRPPRATAGWTSARSPASPATPPRTRWR